MKKSKFQPVQIDSTESMLENIARVVRSKLYLLETQAQLERRIAALRSDYAGDLAAAQRDIDQIEAGIYAYCSANRESLFAARRSMDTPCAVIGFRQDPPHVEKTSRERWDVIALRLLALPWGEKYVREAAPEVNKEALISDRATLTREQLSTVGLDIRSDEHFFIEPKSDLAGSTTIKGVQ